MMKNKILKQSVHLFDEKGFSKTSIQDIMHSLGVTKGTFYYYFNSKQELLRDIHLSYIKHLLKEQDLILKQTNLSSQEKLRKLLQLIISGIRMEGRSARVFTREVRHLDSEHTKEVRSKRRIFRLKFQQVIEEGIKKGEFRNDLRSDIVTFAILGIVNRSYNWYNPDGEVTEEELVQIYMDLITDGLKNKN